MPFPSRHVSPPQISKVSSEHHTGAISPMVVFVLNYCNWSQYPFGVFYIHQDREGVRESGTLPQTKGEIIKVQLFLF